MTPPDATPSWGTIGRMRTSPRLRRTVLAAASAGLLVLASGCRESEPLPVAVQPAVLIPPLHDAQTGEQLRMHRGDEEWVWRVVSASDEEVSVDFFVYRGGVVVEGRTDHLRWMRNSFGIPEGFVIREIRRDRIDVGGTSYDCWRLKAYAREGARYYWITDSLPVSGFLRIALEERGKPLLQTAAEAVFDQ